RADPWSAVASLCFLFSAAGTGLEWRHFTAPGGASAASTEPPESWKALADGPPPAVAEPGPERSPAWMPPRSRLLVRHRRPDGSHVVGGAEPPPGCVPEHVLGAVRDSGYPGTVPLDGELGHLEAAPLP